MYTHNDYVARYADLGLKEWPRTPVTSEWCTTTSGVAVHETRLREVPVSGFEPRERVPLLAGAPVADAVP